MHLEDLSRWQQRHDFAHEDSGLAERSTWIVIGLTASMMVAEIAAGSLFNSMALLADGWHMASHTAALGLTVFAYAYARRHRDDDRFSYGTGKVGVLGGYTSAVALAVIAVLMGAESVGRFLAPRPIGFDEALAVAVLGLAVNLASAWLLARHPDDGLALTGHGHGHGHDAHPHDTHPHGAHPHGAHPHDHDRDAAHQGHPTNDGGGTAPRRDAPVATASRASDPRSQPLHTDHNLRGAYLHVIADALTSVLAIAALLAGKLYGWTWVDPAMGIVGAVLILRWSAGLLSETAHILLDSQLDPRLVARVRRVLERGDDRVTDLHLWHLSPRHRSAVVTLVTHEPQPPEHYKSLLRDVLPVEHVTIEVNGCPAA